MLPNIIMFSILIRQMKDEKYLTIMRYVFCGWLVVSDWVYLEVFAFWVHGFIFWKTNL